MTDEFPNVPPVKFSLEEIEAVKQELGLDGNTDLPLESSESTTPITEQQPIPIKRRRGRPRKYYRDQEGKVLRDRPISPGDTPQEEPLGTLAFPPLIGRDSKEIAKRLQGILLGATSLPAVGIHPAIQMTEKEAENIATPLTAYLMRTEATSQMAQRVLNEYDLAAFVIATLAYMVRVIREVRSERESTAGTADESQGRRILQRTPTSQRVVEPAVESPTPETTGEDEAGQERPVNREWASIATELRNPTEV